MKKVEIFMLLLSIVGIVILVGHYFPENKELDVSIGEYQPPNSDSVKYELIMNDHSFEAEKNTNEALLISDRNDISLDAELFLAPQRYAHLCGYHYCISFWTSDSLFGRKSINEECEIFGYKPEETYKRLDYYFKKLKRSPTHYVYSLAIPVQLTPAEIRKKLKDEDLILVFLEEELARFPSIGFSYRNNMFVGKKADKALWDNAKIENEAESRKKFKEVIDQIKSVSTIVHESDVFYFSYGMAGDSMTHKGHVSLSFELGTDLSKPVAILKEAGVEIGRVSAPELYSIQLVDTCAHIEPIKQRLKPYEFIKEITAYERR